MNTHHLSTDQRITAFINRKAKQFPDIDLQHSDEAGANQTGFIVTIVRSLAMSR